MKKWLVTLLVIVFAAVAGLLLQQDPGQALFSYNNWWVMMPLWLAVAISVICFAVIHYSLLLLRALQNSGKQFSQYRRQKSQRGYQKQLNQALIELSEGHFARAEARLLKSLSLAPAPVIHYLAAARAAHEQLDYTRRDDYIRKAHALSDQADVAVSLTHAQLQLGHAQFEQALATLQHLYQRLPHHTYVLRLLKRLYLEVKDWKALHRLLPSLAQHNIVKEEALHELSIKVYCACFPLHHTSEELNQYWQSLSKTMRRLPEIVDAYVVCLLKQHQYDIAEQVLQKQLKRSWDPKLAQRYSQMTVKETRKQFDFINRFRKSHESDPIFWQALARAAARLEAWEQASDYYQRAIALSPSVVTYHELGHLLETHLNRQHEAMKCYRAGLGLVTTCIDSSDKATCLQ